MTARHLAGLAAAAALALLPCAATPADLPRLPAELMMQKGADSPGQVAFRHESHVDAAKPACLGCHSGRFSLLARRAGEPRQVINHAAMEKGQACGACHGKAAFGFDDCTSCHAK